jgi:hypothetical protein
MKFKNIFSRKIELNDNNWFEKMTLNSTFKLNGLSIGELDNKINPNYIIQIYNNSESDIRKIYRCPKYKNHYKVKNGKIIGFGINKLQIQQHDFQKKFGKHESENVIIGGVHGMTMYDIEGYDLNYKNFRLVLDNEKEKLESIHFGQKLLYWDE